MEDKECFWCGGIMVWGKWVHNDPYLASITGRNYTEYWKCRNCGAKESPAGDTMAGEKEKRKPSSLQL